MIKILKKKKLFLLAIFLCALFLAALYSVPISAKFHSVLLLLDPIFDAQTPVIRLHTEGLSFDRAVPYKIVLDNGVQIIFDKEADSTAFLSSQNYSVFIAMDKILYKKSDKIKSISLENIEIDKDYLEIDPVKVGLFLKKFSTMIVLATGLLLLVLLFVGLYLLVLLAAGLGIMIDAFSNGPYTFGALLNGAALMLLVSVIGFMLLGRLSFKYLEYILIIYYLIYLTLVYWTGRSSKRYDVV